MLTLSRTSRNTVPAGHSALCSYRVISEQRNRSPKPRYTRSDRELFKGGTKQKLVDLARAASEYELADRHQRCFANVTAITCGKHVAKLIPDYTCGSRLCPNCARRRASKLLRKYLSAVVAFPSVSKTEACMLTLTLKHRPETLKASVKRLTDSFKALRRSAIYKAYFQGGMFSVEFTIGKDGLYHTHMHAYVFRTRKLSRDDLQKLKDRWLEITGDSTNLRLDPITGAPIDAAREVLKYTVKPACIDDLTKQHYKDFVAMKKQRMFGTFGEFQKFARTYEPDAEEIESLFPPTATHIGDACSSCGNPLFDVRVKGSELSDFLARLDASPALE